MTRTVASAARTRLRARARVPATPEYTRPKQPQSTSFPRLIALAIPALNARNSARAATPPHRAHGWITRAAAVASSANGSSTATRSAARAGTPKSVTACREPARSKSSATAADPRVPASKSWTPMVNESTPLLCERRARSIADDGAVMGHGRPGRDSEQTFETFGVRFRVVAGNAEELERVR